MQSKTIPETPARVTTIDRDQVARGDPTHVVLSSGQLGSGQLGSGQLRSTVATSGSGGTFLADLAITRWRGDRTADAAGTFIYLRDLDSGEYWSAGYQPTLRQPTDYQVRLRGQSIEFSRCDHQIQTAMSICIAAADPVELRSCTLTNQGSTPRRIELTSYAELVLQDPQADAAHPAFSKLFVETELLDSGLLLARRRQRQAGEVVASAAHFLAGCDGDRADELETDRSRFVGRGQDLSCPRAMQSTRPLAGSVGSVLDPIFSLRKFVSLAPGETVGVVFGLAASLQAQDLAEAASRFASPASVAAAFQAAADAPQQQIAQPGGNGQWRIDTAAPPPAENDGAVATPDTRLPGNPIAAGTATRRFSPPARHNLQPVAAPSTAPPINQDGPPNSDPATGAATGDVRSGGKMPAGTAALETLQFDNGWGGFSADGTEYVIRVDATAGAGSGRPPLPWVNIIANPQLGFIVSEAGAGNTWAGNSRLNRLTPWHNDPVCDPHSEAFYIRDDQRGIFWSPTPGPVPQDGNYEIRHGFGYTKFLHTSHQLHQEVVQFVPREDAVKITCIRLQNLSDQPRRLSLFSYHQWELGEGGEQAAEQTRTKISPEQQAIFATNDQRGEFSAHVAYAALLPGQAGMPGQAAGLPGQAAGQLYFSADRREFLGPHGRLADPLALQTGRPLSGTAGSGYDPCAACQATVEIPAGAALECVVLLGESPTQAEAEAVLSRYQTAAQCREALTEVRNFWHEKLSAVQIQTPSAAIDLLVNGWLSYQNLSCRLWARSAAYQSGGAYGFRDQLQDAAAWVHQWPALPREQIVRNAAHQFVEGDVLHWWHPPLSRGIRTNFSDDLLWLPLFAAEYVATTGDQSLWQERVRFLTGPPVPAGTPEVMLTPQDAGEQGSIYEHCCRALDRGLTTGQHGLPLMGCGDWNDGMNRVGQGGSGESVWLGFFIDYILGLMLPVCQQFEDRQRLSRYEQYRRQLRTALNDAGWDGAWYRRAYFDDGSPLGTAESEECQIDALVQAWAVLSGAAPAERAAQAMSAAQERLVDEQAGLIQLLDPPFDQMTRDPGYIKGYLPGIRENGGQYTHGVLWFVRAVAELGDGRRAVQLLEMLSPINHTRDASGVNTYQAEPYVVAADVYSQAPHAGRAGWSWYTGSAGWMYRVAVESILGFGVAAGETLTINPRIDPQWPEYSIRYRLPHDETCYQITVSNPDGKQSGVTAARLDGAALDVAAGVARIPLLKDGKTHQVEIRL